MKTVDALALSPKLRAEIDRWVARFPAGKQRSAVISALHAAQHENRGYLSRELMEGVAAYLGLPAIQVFEVATFYSMFETKPVGLHSISVCTNISCMLRGAKRFFPTWKSGLALKRERAHRTVAFT